ncbi:hypothetical protein CWI75_13990 [Kineobactrum sediminis]|uniref:PEGA domain-containing protein n=1 Tax=Kineobactrum sediminis TaxID=1905677 RepID=A0A2N5Y0C5_9GAMM|nr:PEGA domain-containing protein [Kineobactrum sediminis]PLW81851.1 hypothetical protein CWI75_13990 [Kineobactrum sediminis]
MPQPEAPNGTITPSAFQPLGDAPPTPPPRRNWRYWLLPTVLLLFVVIMGFLFSARSVEINVDSTNPANVEVGGLHLVLGGRYLLRPGEYSLEISAKGYYPLLTTLGVTREDSQRYTFDPQPLPGRVTIVSQPAGAVIRVAGKPLGQTPSPILELAPGDYSLELEHPHYLPVTRTISVTGRDQAQTFENRLAPAWANVTVASQPAGAEILVNGEPRGVTPATLEILQGERELALRKMGFTEAEQTLNVRAGQAIDLAIIKLVPAAGLLTLSSTPSGANVTLDGDFQGQTPLTLSLKPDQPQRLMLSRSGYRRHTETVRLSAGASDQRAIALVAELGTVDLQVTPAGAEVRVNGKLVGTGNQTLSLPAHEHRVQVSLAGYNTVNQRLTPRPSLEQRVSIDLQTEKEARLARLQPEITTALGQTLRLFIPGESGPAEFTMGSSRREPGRRANEVLRPVSLRRMFYLQTTEVTNAQFRQFLASHNSGQAQASSLNREHQPVAQVSWQQAARFCNWLSEREGLAPFYQQEQGIVTGFNPGAIGYRLPTEAEWSWAARTRGDQLLTFPWGETFPPTVVTGNYADTSSAYITGRTINGYNDDQAVSATVASFPPNHYGLYDLGGNVAEWVHDVYRIPGANSAAETDPTGPKTGDNYVIRGSSWAMGRRSELRLPYRDYGQAGRDDVGFRLARYAE